MQFTKVKRLRMLKTLQRMRVSRRGKAEKRGGELGYLVAWNLT